ncbi:MAG: hypothetical protein KDD53_09990, partial [Bdellovibrionales bacterium]|nr:hypothetical protein [Bdellovibrionales bacterium]
LRSMFPGIEVVQDDVRFVDFSNFGSSLLVFGNLPYSFSTDIVFHLLDNSKCIRRAILLLQKEFAERMASPPGSRDYGVLSVGCQLTCSVSLGPEISPESFTPVPAVNSRLVELNFEKSVSHNQRDLSRSDIIRVVRSAFLKRRKKIHNSLKASGNFAGVDVDAAFLRAQIDPARRAETLSIQEFIDLTFELIGKSK